MIQRSGRVEQRIQIKVTSYNYYMKQRDSRKKFLDKA